MNEPTLTDQNAKPELNEDDAYSALATAMSKGDTAEIDRLMAVADAESDNEKADGHDQVDPLLDSKDSTSTDDDEAKRAADAAHDEQNQNAPNPDNDLEAMRAELHRLRSDVGRVGHLQRTVQELQRQARAHEARLPSTQVAETPPKAEPSKTKDLPEDLKKRIADLKEVDPELADTFEAFAKTMSQQTEARTSELQQEFQEVQREQEEAKHWQEQKAELYQLVPRCDEIFAMPEWSEWKDSLTPGQRGLTESGYAQDMAHAIYVFASHMQARQQAYGNANQVASSQGGDPNTNTNATNDSNTTTVNQEVNDTRARKIRAAADIRSTAAKKVEALDEEKMYSEFYQQIGRANHILPNK